MKLRPRPHVPASNDLRWIALLCIAIPALAFVSTPAANAAQAQSPDSSRNTLQLADPQLAVDWVAAEPDVVSPVAIAWDAAQRLYVVEMRDYPNAATGGRIRRLTDANQDGRYENPETLAEGLAFPTSVLPYRDGVLVLAPPNLWFIPAPDRIESPPQKQLVLSGFGAGNQQLRANSLMFGIDGWIYGANGRSDGQLAFSSPSQTPPTSIVGRDFRFHLGRQTLEALPGRSQFGLALNDWNHRFLSWNTIPARHEVFPERWLSPSKTPLTPFPDLLHDVLPPDDPGRVFPATPPPRVFNNESSTHFNALSGLTLYRGDALGPEYYGNLFVGESLLNLVHRRSLFPDDLSYRAPRTESQTEFLRSSDPWFHPVNFATGPDGALYVVDFYRQFVEHPDWVSAEMRSRVDWATGAQHGRIWRVHRKDGKTASIAAQHPPPSSLKPEALVQRLRHPNAWQRDTAARLLRERFVNATPSSVAVPPQIAAALSDFLLPNHPPTATAHALFLLADFDLLTADLLETAAQSPHARIRELALHFWIDPTPHPFRSRWTAEFTRNPARLAQWIRPRLHDPDPRVVVLALFALRDLPDSTALPLLEESIPSLDAHPWRQNAWIAAALPRAQTVLQRWLTSEVRFDWSSRVMRGLSRALASELPPPRHPAVRPFLDQIVATPPSQTRFLEWPEFWLGWIAAHNRSPNPPDAFVASFPKGTEPALAMLNQLRARLPRLSSLLDSKLGLEPVVQLCQELHDPAPLLKSFQEIAHPASSQPFPADSPVVIGLANALAELVPAKDLTPLLEQRKNWRSGIATHVFTALASRGNSAQAVLDQLQKKLIHPDELSPLARLRLRQSLSTSARSQLDTLLAVNSDRRAAVDSRRNALALPGHPEAGGRLVHTHCLSCHYLLGQGSRVGPDLSAVAARSPETLLSDLLDPNAQVAPGYSTTLVTLTSGDTVLGMLGDSSTHLIRIRKAGGADETLLRSQIRTVENTGRSLMPEGFESAMTDQDIADVLAFLRSPRLEWLHP